MFAALVMFVSNAPNVLNNKSTFIKWLIVLHDHFNQL